MLDAKIQATADTTGTIISVVNTTGSYSADNPGGFGNPNPAISDAVKIYLTLSRLDSGVVYRELFDGSEVQNILLGDVVELNSIVLGMSDATTEGLKAFEDSVYDINEYVFMELFTGVGGFIGEPFIIGTGLSNIILNSDSILVDDVIYQIDKSKPDNGGTVLYLDRVLETAVNEFNPGYRANAKVFVDASSVQARKLLAGKIADPCDPCYDKNKETALDIQIFIVGALDLFEDGDYKGADTLIKHAYRMSKCKSGCS